MADPAVGNGRPALKLADTPATEMTVKDETTPGSRPCAEPTPKPIRLLSRPLVRAAILLPALLATFPAAVLLRYDGWPRSASLETITILSAMAAVVKVASFYAFGVLRIRTRYLALDDLLLLARATLFGSLAFTVLALTCPLDFTLGRSVWGLDWVVTIGCCYGVQVARRVLVEPNRRVGRRAAAPCLIIGTERIGEALLHAIRRDSSEKYDVRGFVGVAEAGHPVAVGTTIGGLPVVAELASACRVAAQRGVGSLLVTAGDLPGPHLRTLVSEAEDSGIDVTVLPSYRQLLSGEVSLRPREVEIEDLLRRDPVELETSRLSSWLKGRTVLVTGSSGSIGSEVCRQLIQFEPGRLVLVDQNETGQFFLDRELSDRVRQAGLEVELVPVIADVSDERRLDALFATERPEVIFHAAAYKHVPLMEQHGYEAVKTNVLGSKLLADLADRYEAESFVMVSTDKAVRPTSRMGATKRIAELYIQSLATRSQTRFVTVRFGNVLGSAGSVVPIFRQQIAAGGPVTVTHPDMTRFFMTIPEAAQLIIQAGGQGNGGEIFVLDMGRPVRVLNLAQDMIRLSGLVEQDEIEIVFTGTRPGEKITEELYTGGEVRRETEHKQILVAESEEINFFRVARVVADLARPSAVDNAVIDALIASLVPSYRSLTIEAGTVGEIPARKQAA